MGLSLGSALGFEFGLGIELGQLLWVLSLGSSLGLEQRKLWAGQVSWVELG